MENPRIPPGPLFLHQKRDARRGGSKAWCTDVAKCASRGCKKGMGPTVITPDVVSSVFASRECGLLRGDAREVLRTLADDSVDCTVTSPPYYSGRRHVGDTIHEIGSERTVAEYVDAIRKASSPPIWGKNGLVKATGGSVPTDVWTIQIEDSTSPENPYAVFPEALVELPIRATCPRGGTVLDPFVGSGTTAVVALRLGRKAIGIDASADCLEFTKKRILEVSGQSETPRRGR